MINPKKGLKLATAPLSRENQNIVLFYDVRNQSHLTGAFDLGSEFALVFGTGSGKAGSFDLAHIRSVLTHDVNVFVLYDKLFVRAELAVFLTGELFLSIAEIHFVS
jgi:hypothetical protein